MEKDQDRFYHQHTICCIAASQLKRLHEAHKGSTLKEVAQSDDIGLILSLYLILKEALCLLDPPPKEEDGDITTKDELYDDPHFKWASKVEIALVGINLDETLMEEPIAAPEWAGKFPYQEKDQPLLICRFGKIPKGDER